MYLIYLLVSITYGETANQKGKRMLVSLFDLTYCLLFYC